MIDHVPVSDPEIKNSPYTFLFLGIITKQKGIYDLVKVIGLNKEQLCGKFKLIIAGCGNVNMLNEMIDQFDIHDLVEYKGWVSGNEKDQLIKNADVFILPSYFEGLPISILEAMSFGKPIISTRVGGIPEVVETGVNGILVDAGNFNEIFAALMFYIDKPMSLHKHGCQSLQKIKDYYPAAIIPQLKGIYSILLEKDANEY